MREGYGLADTTIELSVLSETKLKDTDKAFLHKMLKCLPSREPGLTQETRATAAERERSASRALVTGIAIGDRDEFDSTAKPGEFRGCACRTNIAVIRMRAEGDNANLFSLGAQQSGSSEREDKPRGDGR